MKRILSYILTLLVSLAATAQTSLTGRVLDASGAPIVGALIRVDATHGAISDVRGRYTIESVPANVTEVEASFIGYISQTKAISGSSLDFILQETAVDIQQVVCTGTRTPRVLKDAPIATRVVTSEQIRTSDATNVGDFLQTELPGAEISYAMNQQPTINLQGFGGNAVLFLVDGERLAGETMENTDYSRLNLDDVARIEIVKGASSSLYGSNAVGGVVNIISKQATAPWTLNVNGRISKYHDQRYGATLGINRGKVSSVTNFSYASCDSIHMPADGDFTKLYAYKTYTIKERLTVRPTDNLRLIGRASYFYRDRESSTASTEIYRDLSAGLKGEMTFTENDNAELSYSYDEYDKSDLNIAYNLDIRDYRNNQNIVRALYNHTFTSLTGSMNSTLTVGGDFFHDYLMTYQFEDNGDKNQNSVDAFAQMDWNINNLWNLIGGIRYDFFSAASQSHVTGKLGAMYKARPGLNLRASYAGGFRAPSLKEMYMEFNMASIFTIYGNPELEPETSHNFSISAEKLTEHLNVTANIFSNLVDNRITTAWNQALNGMRYVNMARLNISGAELTVIAKWANGLSAQAGYTFTNEYIKAGEPLTSSTRPHALNGRVSYARDWTNYGFKLSLQTRYLSRFTTDEYTSYTDYTQTEEVDYPGYSITRLSLTQRVYHGIRVNLGIDNLFNYTPSYYYANSPFTTGITFNAGISVDVDQLFH